MKQFKKEIIRFFGKIVGDSYADESGAGLFSINVYYGKESHAGFRPVITSPL